MDPILVALAAFATAAFLGTVVTPLVRSWAVAIDFVDRPDGSRKKQSQPVALGGGLAILIVTLSVFFAISLLPFLSPEHHGALLGLLGASLIIVVTGFVDDRYGINGKVKLLLQVVAAGIVMGTDRLIGEVDVMGITIQLGVLTHVVTLIWMLAAINSLNLIDGVDGLAANVGLVFATSFGVIALIAGVNAYGVLSFCLAGSLLGFLRYNSAPASIYLGDMGSMLVGLVLGAIAMHCALKEAAALAFSAPLTIWAIPFFDSLSAILRRKLTGRSIYATDRGHIHHVLLTKGLDTRSTVAIITGLCFLISLATVMGVYLRAQWIGVLAAVLVIAALVATRLFGHVELVLLNRRLVGIGRYITQLGSRKAIVEQTSISLQGEKDWDLIWDGMVETAQQFGLVTMRLNLFLPNQHENFFASWKRRSAHPEDNVWRLEVPFIAQGAVVGRLKVSGDLKTPSCVSEMLGFLAYLESIEMEIQSRSEEATSVRPSNETTPIPVES